MFESMFYSLRSQNGSIESWQSPPQLACVSEEGETMAGDPGVVTTASQETMEGYDAMESGESAGSGSVYGRRNPWGNQSYADLITQVRSAGVVSSTIVHVLYFRPFLAAERGG